MELNLKGKRALITGGSKGIGLAIKKALEAEGVECISWSRSEGVNCLDWNLKMPEVDILINNVGGGGTSGDVVHVTAINLGTCIYLTKLWMEQKEKRDYGRVITISSIYGKERGHNPIFTAAKAGQIAFMKSLSGIVGDGYNTTFNTICPGHIDVGKPFPDKPEIVGKPEDVANIVTFLCSDLAKHINGACITVDGGVSHSF